MRKDKWLAATTFTLGAICCFPLGATASPAQQDVMKTCGERYQQAKAAHQLGARTWNEFLAECRSQMSQSPQSEAKSQPAAPSDKKTSEAKGAEPNGAAAKPTPEPAPTGAAVFPSKVDPKYSKEPEYLQRQKTCGDQYKANKASNANGGLKWIQKGGGYWSECNKHLKGA